MQLESLKVFIDVVRLKSFSKGAQANQVTQSTASQAIQHLEAHLGVTLIDRSKRPWNVTDQGFLFFEGCRELLQRYEDLEKQLKSLNQIIHSLVRVAAIYSVSYRNMSLQVQKFAELFPGSEVQMEYLHPDRVYEKVLTGEADLGIVSFPNARREFLVTPWKMEPMVLTCYPTHRLAGRYNLPVSEMQGEAFVGFDGNLVIRKEIDRFLKQRGVSVNVILEFDNVEAIKRAVESEAGISLLPHPTLSRELEIGTLHAIPLDGGTFSRPLGIIRKKGKECHEGILRFLGLLTGEKNARPAKEILSTAASI